MQLCLEDAGAGHPASRAGSAPALQRLSLGFSLRLSLQVRSGEQLAVIGPSGAGKTTLLHVLACALPPSSGRLLLDGQDPWTLPRHALQRQRGRLFLAPQVPPLPPRQRVVTAVLAGRLPQQRLWASLRSLLHPTELQPAHDALAGFDLAEKLFERVDRLSGGERQRVGLARALLAPAGLWLIDEPLSALDSTRAAQALATLQRVARERGVTLVATLHQVDVALAHFDRIVGLRDGALAFDLPAAQVTPERLARLYAQHEEALVGGPHPHSGVLPPLEAKPSASRAGEDAKAPPAAMCR